MKYKVHLVSDVVIDVEAENIYIIGNSYVFGPSESAYGVQGLTGALVKNANGVFPIENVSHITKEQ